MAQKHGLGRGLESLIRDVPVSEPQSAEQGQILRVPVTQVRRSPLQPRRVFSEESLADLVSSVKARGVLQPLLVRKSHDGYELMAGERRLMAATRAGLAEVPVVVMEAADSEALEIGLVENLQREDLNPIEEAEGYQALASKFGMTQDRIAERVGKARATVANAMRLLDLSDEVKQMLSDGRLQVGHAKVLLSVQIPEEQCLLARRAVRERLSVRDLEKILEKMKRIPRRRRAVEGDIPGSHIGYLSDLLHGRFGTSIRIASCKTLPNGKKVKGTIEIDFYSNEDLDRILDLLGIKEGQ